MVQQLFILKQSRDNST